MIGITSNNMVPLEKLCYTTLESRKLALYYILAPEGLANVI